MQSNLIDCGVFICKVNYIYIIAIIMIDSIELKTYFISFNLFLTNDVVVSHSVSLNCYLSPKLTLQSQQIFMYLEELATLHCKDVSRRKTNAVKLLWPMHVRHKMGLFTLDDHCCNRLLWLQKLQQ